MELNGIKGDMRFPDILPFQRQDVKHEPSCGGKKVAGKKVKETLDKRRILGYTNSCLIGVDTGEADKAA